MIYLDPPHVTLNDERSNMTLTMTYSIPVRASDSPRHVINRVARLPERRLKNVVFNCHGSSGHMEMGLGFGIEQAALFRRWRGKVEKIWFYACSVADGTDGVSFCAAVARNASCYVLASPAVQWESSEEMAGLPPGCLDTFEGLLFSFNERGFLGWSHAYPNSGGPNPS